MKHYCEKYPDNQDALFKFSTLIKDEHPLLFQATVKRLLISADQYYHYASQYTDPLGLSTKEFLRLIYNLHRALKYAEALRLLTLWQEQNQWDRRLDIALADTYYRLRRYNEAGRLYEKNKRYKQAALSYFRAGNGDGLERLIALTKNLRGKAPCMVLILRAKQIRDNRMPLRALSYLRRAYREYEDCKEDALWEIAWTEYLQGQYLHAAYNLRDLFKRYNRPRYLYWLNRANSHLNLKELKLNSSLKKDSLYFSLLRYSSDRSNFLLNSDRLSTLLNYNLNSYSLPSEVKERVLDLKAAGLGDYIKRELLYRIKRETGGVEGYVYALLENGFYKEALKVAKDKPFKDEELKRIALYPLSYRDFLVKIASQLSLDPLLLLSVMRVESHFDHEALSRSGAMGLMQLMDFTAKRWAKAEGMEISLDDEGENSVFSPEVNIRLGAVYLKWLLDRFENPFLAVASYNAGENAVSRWLKSLKYNGLDEFLELIPYDETRNYVKKVFSTYEMYRLIYLN